MPEIIRVGSLELRFLHDKHDTHGSLDVFEMLVPPGAQMPVAHHHRDWDETAYGLEGTLTFTMDGKPYPRTPAITCSSRAASCTASTTAAAPPRAAWRC